MLFLKKISLKYNFENSLFQRNIFIVQLYENDYSTAQLNKGSFFKKEKTLAKKQLNKMRKLYLHNKKKSS